MTVELQLTVVSYGDETQQFVLRRSLPDGIGVARRGDHVAANENWEPVAVADVVWDETLSSAVVVLEGVDADEVGPASVAVELLESAGWQLVAASEDADASMLDPAASTPGFD